MVRTGTYKSKVGSRNYRRYSKNDLAKAVSEVKAKKLTQRQASENYGIPLGTINNKVHRKHEKKSGGQSAFLSEEEDILVAHILTLSDWGFPLEVVDLQVLVKNLLQKTRKTIKVFKNNIPSQDWVRCFIKKHKDEIAQRMCQNIATNRAAVSPQIIGKFFKNLKSTLTNEDGTDVPPENIINYDETCFSDDPGSKKCIFRRRVKYPERVRNSTKTNISVMFAGSASGIVLPPYIVYKAEHLWTLWTEGGLPKARYNRSRNGLFDNHLFTKWYRTVLTLFAKNAIR